MTFLSHLINGISLGSVYAIIALGYTMVYGIAKMLNFAHGDVIMVGAYISFCTTSYLGLSPLVSVLFSIIVCTVLGIVVERLAYKPLRQAPSLAVLITAIGVSYFLQNAALLIWGSSPKTFSSVTGSWTLKLFDGQLIVSGVTIVTILACILIMICLTLFTNKTKMGTAMRAVSEDKAAAGLMGINVNTTISLTFAIGSGLAAIAGVLLCSAYPTLMPTTGSRLRRQNQLFRLQPGCFNASSSCRKFHFLRRKILQCHIRRLCIDFDLFPVHRFRNRQDDFAALLNRLMVLFFQIQAVVFDITVHLIPIASAEDNCVGLSGNDF